MQDTGLCCSVILINKYIYFGNIVLNRLDGFNPFKHHLSHLNAKQINVITDYLPFNIYDKTDLDVMLI